MRTQKETYSQQKRIFANASHGLDQKTVYEEATHSRVIICLVHKCSELGIVLHFSINFSKGMPVQCTIITKDSEIVNLVGQNLVPHSGIGNLKYNKHYPEKSAPSLLHEPAFLPIFHKTADSMCQLIRSILIIYSRYLWEAVVVVRLEVK